MKSFRTIYLLGLLAILYILVQAGIVMEQKEMTTQDLFTGAFCIELLDVQGLFGGRNVIVYSDGQVRVQSVRPSTSGRGLKEKRYCYTLPGKELQAIQDDFIRYDFVRLDIEDRQGVPDEARPEIVVRGENDRVHRIEAWERTELNPDEYCQSDKCKFDSLYKSLERLERVALEHETPQFKGKYKDYSAWKKFKTRAPKR